MKVGSPKNRGPMLAAILALAWTVGAWAAHDTLFLVGRTLGKPTYWIAILAVRLSQAEKEEFYPHLADFRVKVASLLPEGGKRCAESKNQTTADQACVEEGKTLQNCEALEVHWNDDPTGRQGKLSLWVQEEGAATHSLRRGEIGHHYCAADATFEECFVQQWDRSLATLVQEHDAMCHQGLTCIVENGQFRPERSLPH
jgi:DNA-binding MarR family transcriptional regulator